MLVVLLWTPSNCLQKEMCAFSIGLFAGSFRIPQKSLAYNKMGSITALITFSVISGLVLKKLFFGFCECSHGPIFQVF